MRDDPVVLDGKDDRDITHVEDVRGSSEETDIGLGLTVFDNSSCGS